MRNPAFSFDEAVDSRILLEFFTTQIISMIRGLKVLIRFKNPKLMLLGRGVRFEVIGRIRWGKFLKIGRHTTLSGLGTEGISLGNNVGLGAFSRIIVSTSLNNVGKGITIGDNVGIGEYAYLGGAGGLEIGDNVIVGQYLSCHPENHNYSDSNELIRNQGVNRKGIKVGANCWLGSKVTILDGVEIGEGSIIAAGAVVTTSFPPNSIIGGVPAKLLKSR